MERSLFLVWCTWYKCDVLCQIHQAKQLSPEATLIPKTTGTKATKKRKTTKKAVLRFVTLI
jgi:hypothetical protein